ncbi:hypothetical protein D3C80_39900 [compost metagenome]
MRTEFHELDPAQHDVQRDTASVCCQMDFCAKTTARATQAIISGDIGIFFGSGSASERPDIADIQRSR